MVLLGTALFGPNLWVWYLVFQSVGMTFPIWPDTYAVPVTPETCLEETRWNLREQMVYKTKISVATPNSS